MLSGVSKSSQLLLCLIPFKSSEDETEASLKKKEKTDLLQCLDFSSLHCHRTQASHDSTWWLDFWSVWCLTPHAHQGDTHAPFWGLLSVFVYFSHCVSVGCVSLWLYLKEMSDQKWNLSHYPQAPRIFTAAATVMVKRNFQKCFVDWETSRDFWLAWGWWDNDWMFHLRKVRRNPKNTDVCWGNRHKTSGPSRKCENVCGEFITILVLYVHFSINHDIYNTYQVHPWYVRICGRVYK